MTPYTDQRPSRRTAPWPPRSSEGPPRYPRRVVRAGRLRSLVQILAVVLLGAAAVYSWGGWAAGGWFAVAGWVALGVLSLALVGWVWDLVVARRLDRQFRDRPARRRA